ncbi:MAG: hypothetical protein AB1491_06205 [Thermodesulfobacteriota bacterium]
MAAPVVIRYHDGFQSYLVLDDHPRELLRHWGFAEEFSMRPWLGSTDPTDAMEEWAEMLAEDLENYLIADEDNWQFRQDRPFWDKFEK